MQKAKRATIYARVSTEKQKLESRWMTVETWAKSRNVNIDEGIVEEEPVSGAEDVRPRFQELWRRVKQGGIGTIVVAGLSRLSWRMRRSSTSYMIVSITTLWWYR